LRPTPARAILPKRVAAKKLRLNGNSLMAGFL
jgi:hypothetical protein